MFCDNYYAETGVLLATHVARVDKTTKMEFFTDPKCPLQVGAIAYRKDGVIPLHFHNPLPRSSVGTTEVLYVVSGSVRVTLWDTDRSQEFVAGIGDLIILQQGSGHELTMLADTVLLECKTGPYIDRAADKTFVRK